MIAGYLHHARTQELAAQGMSCQTDYTNLGQRAICMQIDQ